MRWHISMRYFVAHKRQSFVCIAGVTLSVAIFLSMTAMMRGFTDKFIIETVEATGHIVIHDEPREAATPILERAFPEPHAVLELRGAKPREQVKQIKNADGLLRKLRHLPGIQAAAPEVGGHAIATYGTRHVNVAVLGVEPDSQIKVTTIGRKLIAGDFARLYSAANGVVLGRGIAAKLGAGLDDSIILTSQAGGRLAARVVGIFETGVTPVDLTRAYMLVNNAQSLLDQKNVINRIVLRTDDYHQARAAAAQIEAVVGYRTESWQESNANYIDILATQNIIMAVITIAILVVAAFGVLNILIMAVLERVNDIAILRSFGFSRADITAIYLFQGMVIGLIGALLGLGLGKLLIEALQRLPIKIEGMVKSEGLLMAEYPHQYVLALAAAMVVVTLAAIYPAYRAATYDPVEIIRGVH